MKLTCFFLLILFIPFAYSAGTSEIFNNWSNSGEYKTKNHINFSVFFNPESFEGLFTINNNSAIVDNSSCRTADLFTLCIDNMTKSKFDASTFLWTYKGKVRILMKVPEVYIEKTIPASVLMADTFDIIATFGNKGVINAKNAVVSETFPEKMFLIISSSCPMSGNKLSWAGELGIGKEYQCRVSLKPIASGKYESKTEISYFDGIETKKVSSAKSINIIDHGLTIKQVFAKAKAEVNTELLYSVEIEAKKKLDFTNFILKFPKGISVISKPGNATLESEAYVLGKGTFFGKKEFSFKLLPQFLGNQTSRIEASYQIEKIQNTAVNKASVIITSLLPEAKAYSNMSKGKGSFYIVNLAKMAFRDIEVNYSINGENYSQTISEILPNSHFEIKFNASGNPAEIAGTLNYISQFSEKLKGNFSLKIQEEGVKVTAKTPAKTEKKQTTGNPPQDKKEPASIVNSVLKKPSKTALIIIGVFAVAILIFVIQFRKKLLMHSGK